MQWSITAHTRIHLRNLNGQVVNASTGEPLPVPLGFPISDGDCLILEFHASGGDTESWGVEDWRDFRRAWVDVGSQDVCPMLGRDVGQVLFDHFRELVAAEVLPLPVEVSR